MQDSDATVELVRQATPLKPPAKPYYWGVLWNFGECEKWNNDV